VKRLDHADFFSIRAPDAPACFNPNIKTSSGNNQAKVAYQGAPIKKPLFKRLSVI